MILNNVQVSTIKLVAALKSGDIQILKNVIAKYNNINDVFYTDGATYTPITYAIAKNNTYLVDELIKIGANINKIPENIEHPIFQALQMGHYMMARYLLSKAITGEINIDATVKTIKGHDLIEFMALNMDEYNILSHSMHFNYMAPMQIFADTEEHRIEIFKKILELYIQQKIDINKSNNGLTYLGLLTNRGIYYLVDTFLSMAHQLGLDVNKKNRLSKNNPIFLVGNYTNNNLEISPILMACHRGLPDIIKKLISLGANILDHCSDNNNATFYAKDHKDALRYIEEIYYIKNEEKILHSDLSCTIIGKDQSLTSKKI